jgi:hypothetical protein
MRRLSAFAAFLFVFASLPLCAQRGVHAAGGHGGFSGHSAFASRSIAGFGAHFAPSRMGSRHAPGSRSFRDNRFRSSRFRSFSRGRCFGCGYAYPFYAYNPYWDSWWWDQHSSYDEDGARDREEAAEMNRENLDLQDRLRQRDQDLYVSPAARQNATQESAQNDPPTVLIFRDEHQREIHNYAIADGILWSFTAQRTEKIPLAVLDLPATARANEKRGVEFRLPQSSGGE